MQKAKFVNISAGKIFIYFFLMFSLLIFALQSVSDKLSCNQDRQ